MHHHTHRDSICKSWPLRGFSRFNSDRVNTRLKRSFSDDNIEHRSDACELRKKSVEVLRCMQSNVSNKHLTKFNPIDKNHVKRCHPVENGYIRNIFRGRNESTYKDVQECTDSDMAAQNSITRPKDTIPLNLISKHVSSKTLQNIENTKSSTTFQSTDMTKECHVQTRGIETQLLKNIKSLEPFDKTTSNSNSNLLNDQNQRQNYSDISTLVQRNNDSLMVDYTRKRTMSRTTIPYSARNIRFKNRDENNKKVDRTRRGSATNSSIESGVSVTNYTIYSQNSSVSVESKDKYVTDRQCQESSGGNTSGNLAFIMSETLLLMERHKNENVFVRSRAFDAARRNLELNNLVTITGNPGEGKTSLGIELLVFFAQGEPSFKRTPVKVHNCWDLRVITSQRKDLVIFIDDLFASKSFEKQGKEDWQNTFEIMAATIKESDVMIILAMNNQILNRYRKDLEKYDIFEKKMIVDLNHEATSLTIVEKAKLLENHLESNRRLLPSLKKDTDSVAKIEDTFAYPMCCHLFSRHEEYLREGGDFFRYPLISLCRELETMKNNASSKMQFVLLVSILLFDGVDEIIFKVRAKSSKMLALRDFASSIKCECPSAHDLNVLQELLNIFVIYKRKYLFKNNIIREAVCLIYGSCCPKDQSEQALDMLSMNVLCRFVKVTNCTVSCVCWHIDEGLHCKLGTRLLNGLSFETIEIVANHSAWESSDFCNAAFDSDIKRKDLYEFLAPVPHGSRSSSLLYKIIERSAENHAFLMFSKLLLNSIKHAIDRSRFSRRLCKCFQEVINDCLWLALECEDQDIVLLSLNYGAEVDDEIIRRSKRIQNRNIVELICPK